MSALSVSPVAPTGDPVALLAAARRWRDVAQDAEIELLRTVVDWVAANPPEARGEAAVVRVAGGPSTATVTVPLNGEGCPQVASHAVAEIAAVLGMSTQAGQTLVGEAIELAYRLPGLWARVLAGEVAVWRARKVARATITLRPTAAAFVDRQLACAIAAAAPWQIDGLVTEALIRFEPDQHREQVRREHEQRHLDVRLSATTLAGLVPVDGLVELPDALDLETAVAHAADQRSAWGDADAEGVRRGRALGDLARAHLAWYGQPAPGGEIVEVETIDGETTVRVLERPAADEPTDEQVGRAASGSAREARDRDVRPGPGAGEPVTASRLSPCPPLSPRQVVLYVHLSERALAAVSEGAGPSGVAAGGADLCRVEGARLPIDVEAVRRWCGSPGARVTVRPVLDVSEEMVTDAYEVPERIAEQVRLRDGTCVFPYCTAPARSGDIDHIEPYDHDDPAAGGRTTSSNLAPLCRRHHGLKTRRWWTYVRTVDGSYDWCDRFGNSYRRDRRGTRALAGPDLRVARASPP